MSYNTRIINKIFEELFNEKLNPKSKEHKDMIQSTIYILENLGLLDKYNFIFTKNGPYSIALNDDILNEKEYKYEIKFSKEAIENLSKMKKVLETETTYNKQDWIKSLATMHYLRDRILPYDSILNDVAIEASKRIQTLNNIEENKKALITLKNYFKYI